MLSYLMIFILVGPSFLIASDRVNPPNMLQEIASAQNPSPLTIEMVIHDSARKAAEKPYQVGSKGQMKLVAKNDSDQRIKVILVDTYYQNRPRLFKDGKLLAYREEIKRLVRSKDKDFEFVRVGSVVFLEPYSSRDLEEVNLSDWYGPLEPGSYRLINRHRFEIDGPWTADSAELLFEVVPKE